MAKFDENKDVLVKSYGSVEVNEARIDVEARQYDGGDVKLQLRRMYDDKPRKLGRLTNGEVLALVPLLEEFVNDSTK